MSVGQLSKVWESAPAEGADLLVLMALADQAADETGEICPDLETVASLSRLGVEEVEKRIGWLIYRGVLEPIVAAEGMGYRIVLGGGE